jgi:hypothetical protein
MANQGTGSLLKTGLILAAVIIIIRIVLEQVGAPESVNRIFGVAWLYFIFPVLFALRIAADGGAGGFKRLVKDLFFFALYTRLMVAVTYVLAYFLQWQAPRFSAAGGGTVGPDITPVAGILAIPAFNAVIWIITAVIFGGIIGGITLAIKKKTGGASN